jgi:hypothetical protein
MPLPTPNAGEEKEGFLKRCMSNPTMVADYEDQSQRYAVCNRQWDASKRDHSAGTLLELLAEPLRRFRGPVAHGIATETGKIYRGGGDFGGGLIGGAAVITRGEALGHDLWSDVPFLEQVTKAVNHAPGGVKGRFTHPAVSGDGLGKTLGRWRNASLDGDVVRADLHLHQSAAKTPDGDLAEYVISLAEEDPAAFGASISFDADFEAEGKFRAKHTGRDGIFRSPDEQNIHQFPHARLAALDTVDVVDSPASNPDGLFHRGRALTAQAMDRLLEFALCGQGDCPAPEQCMGLDAVRVRAFLARFLDSRGLLLTARDSIGRRAMRLARQELLDMAGR